MGFSGATSIRDWARTMISLIPKKPIMKKDFKGAKFRQINFGQSNLLLFWRGIIFLSTKITEESIAVPLSLVSELLQDLGGQCRGKAPLAKLIMKEVSCSKATAYRAIENAIDKNIHETDEHLVLIAKM